MKSLALCLTLFAVVSMLATPCVACGVACGSVALAVPSYSYAIAAPAALAAPAYCAVPQVSVNMPATVGVSCGSVAVAAPAVTYAAPLTAVLPSYSYAIATPFVAIASPVYASAVLLSAHVRLRDRLAEHRAVRLNARAQHAAIRAQR